MKNPSIPLARLENERGLRILFAAETGVRAWGIAANDAPPEVGFFYDAPRREDFLVTHREGVTLTGIPVGDVAALLEEADLQVLDLMKSPRVYRAEPVFALLLGAMALGAASPARQFREHLRLAREKIAALPGSAAGRLGRYLEALRSVLACRWIERGRGPVPVDFPTLSEGAVDERNLRIQIAVLVARRRAETGEAPAQEVPAVREFLALELARLGRIVPVGEPAGLAVPQPEVAAA